MGKRVKLNEIVKGDVTFVSLVKRGANRIPFRMTKSEDDMIDFNLDPFGVFQKSDKNTIEPAIASVIVRKGADLELAKARIAKAGLSIDNMEDHEDGHIFKQEGVEGETVLIKYDDDIAAQVVIRKGFSPMDFDTTSFSDLWSTVGVYPTVCEYLSVAKEGFYNVMHESETSDQAADKVQKMFSELTEMVVALVRGIPTKSFKLEDEALLIKIKEELEAKSDDADAEDANEDSVDAEVPEDEVTEDQVEGDSEIEDEDDSDDADAAEEADDSEDLEKSDKSKDTPKGDHMDDENKDKMSAKDKGKHGKKKPKGEAIDKEAPCKKEDSSAKEDSVVDPMIQKMELLLEQSAATLERLSKLEEQVDATTATAQDAVQRAKSAEKVLGSTVIADSAGDRDVNVSKKNESQSEDFLMLDTAYTGTPD